MFEAIALQDNVGSLHCFENLDLFGDSTQEAGSEFIVLLETAEGDSAVADIGSARRMLKGKSIVLSYNEVTVEDSWDEPVKNVNRFIYLPIHTIFTEEYRMRLHHGHLLKQQDLFTPFYKEFMEETHDVYHMEQDESRVLRHMGAINGQPIAAVSFS